MPEMSYTVTVPKDLEDLVPGFMQNRRKEIDALREALRKSDFEQLRQLGHRMKGVGNSYGFAQVSAIGANVENAARAKDATAAEKLIGEYAQFVDNVTIVYA